MLGASCLGSIAKHVVVSPYSRAIVSRAASTALEAVESCSRSERNLIRDSLKSLTNAWTHRYARHDAGIGHDTSQQPAAGDQHPLPRTVDTSNPPLKPTAPDLPRRPATLDLKAIKSPPSTSDRDPGRKQLVDTLLATQSPSEGWEAYSALLHLPCPQRQDAGMPNIPFLHLHRLSRLLARSQPRTRDLFLRLLSVLRTIRDTGGTVHLDEWNALIHMAGRGWRKTRLEDFKVAMDVYHDMISCRSPGTALSGSTAPSSQDQPPSQNPIIVAPDIVTYTTLLSVAGRTSHAPAVHHVTNLIKASGIPPNRFTHLTLLRFFARTNQLPGVYSTLLKMKEQGFELGLDGLNACLFAFSRNRRLDVAFMIYRVLRHRVVPESKDDIDRVTQHLSHAHDIDVPDDLAPDRITYITMIQNLAYNGYLVPALEVFADLLAFMDLRASSDDGADKFASLVPAFRGMFLGFARHGTSLRSCDHPQVLARTRLEPSAEESAWTATNLDVLFRDYLALSSGSTRPGRGTLYWILVSFQKTSGGDMGKMREVWIQLEDKFPGPWAGPNHRLERLRRRIFA